jgi:hypothetical protein
MVGREHLEPWDKKGCRVMPYEIKADGENYLVVNKETGDVKATHTPPDAKEKAERQVALLHHVENDTAWDEGDD